MSFIKISSIFSFFFLLNCFYSFSQELVFINGSDEHKEFIKDTEIYGRLQADQKDPVYFRTKTGKINLDDFSFDSIVYITVEGRLIHPYVYQYTRKQFEKLDTITLYQTNRIYEPTPRIYLNKDCSLDSVIRDEAAVLKYFLDESSMDSTFSIEIYHARSLSKKDMQRIAAMKATFCKEVGVAEKSIQLIDKKMPYTCVRFDFFNPKTLITEAFIKNQNTPWMRARAEEYSLVLVTEIIWKQ